MRSWTKLWSLVPFAHGVDAGDLRIVIRCVRADRASVEKFRAREPQAARAIGVYLDRWLEDLGTIETVARLATGGDDDGACYRQLMSKSKHRYGDSGVAA